MRTWPSIPPSRPSAPARPSFRLCWTSRPRSYHPPRLYFLPSNEVGVKVGGGEGRGNFSYFLSVMPPPSPATPRPTPLLGFGERVSEEGLSGADGQSPFLSQSPLGISLIIIEAMRALKKAKSTWEGFNNPPKSNAVHLSIGNFYFS